MCMWNIYLQMKVFSINLYMVRIFLWTQVCFEIPTIIMLATLVYMYVWKSNSFKYGNLSM